MTNKQTSLTSGNVSSQLIRFAIPFLVANLLQSLYGIADMVIIGHFVGEAGISSLMVSTQIVNALGACVIGLSAGGTILIAQYVGANRREEIAPVMGTLFTSFFILSAIVMTVMLAASRGLLELLKTPPQALEDAVTYLDISLWGTMFITGYNVIAAVFRGLGDSMRPMMIIGIAAVVNIVFSVVLVAVFGMGVRGAALGTFISQCIAFLIAIVVLLRSDVPFVFRLRSFRVQGDKLRLLLNLGVPGGIQQILVQMSFLVVTSLINSYGMEASAVAGIGGKVNGLAILPTLAIMTAVSAMSGQNIGAGLPDRAFQTMLSGVRLALPLSLVLFVLVNLFPGQVIHLFSPEASVATGVPYLRLLTMEYITCVALFCMNGLIQGAGYPRVVLLNTVVSAILLRVPLAYLFAHGLNLGLQGVGLSIVLSPLGATVCALLFLRSGKWKVSRVVRQAAPER